MGKSVELDEEGLPIPQKVKVAKASNDFDDEGLPIPKKKTSSSNIYTNPSDLLQKALSGRGQVGTSAVPSVSDNGKKVLDYMQSTKTAEQKSYSKPAITGTPILPAEKKKEIKRATPKEVEEEALRRFSSPLTMYEMGQAQTDLKNVGDDPNDPIGQRVNQLTIEAKNAIKNSEGLDLPELSKEIAVKNKQIELLKNYSIRNGIEAKHTLQKLTGIEADLDRFSVEDIQKKVPQTLTGKIALEKYLNRRIIDEAAASSDNLFQMAAKVYGGEVGERGEPTTGEPIDRLLNDPDVIQKAETDHDFNIKYQETKANLYNQYPEYAQKQIATKIAQKLEDTRATGWFYANPDLKQVTKAIEQLKEEGNWTPQDQYHFDNNGMKIAIALGAGDSVIPTTDVVHSFVNSAKGAFGDIGETGIDLTNKFTGGLFSESGEGALQAFGLMEGNEEKTARKEREAINTATVDPKGYRKYTSGAAGFLGFSVPMIAAGAVGVPGTATMVLQFEGHNANEARRMFKNTGEQNLYTLLSTGIDAFLMKGLGTDKAAAGIKRLLKNDAADIVKKLSNKSITESVAEKTLTGKFTQALGTIAKHNTTTANTLVAFELAHNTLNSAFGKRDFNIENEVKEQVDNYALKWLSATGLSAASGIGAKPTTVVDGRVLRDMAERYDDFAFKIEKVAEKNPALAKEMQANLDHVHTINEMLKLQNKKPEEIEKYLATALKQKVAQEAIKASPDKALAKADEQKVKIAEIEKEHILNPMSNTKLVESLFDFLPEGDKRTLSVDNEGKKLDESKIGGYLKEIAQQANNLDENFKPHEGKETNPPRVPESIIDAANKRWNKEIEAAKQKLDFDYDKGEPIISENTEQAVVVPKEESVSVPEVKKGVSEVYNNSSEISKIGTEQEYADYLDSIFPESKFKDVVYHGSRDEFEDFNDNIFFALGREYAEGYSKVQSMKEFQSGVDKKPIVYSAIVDVKDITNKNDVTAWKLPKEFDTVIGNDALGKEQVLVIRKGSQAHILGSKKDIEGFKKWKETQSQKTKADETKPNIEEVTETVEPIPSKEGEPPTGTPPETIAGAKEEGDKKGITHAATEATTRKAGLPDREPHTPVTHEARITAAKKAIKENENLPFETMEKVEKGGNLSPQDNAVLAVHKAKLDAELEANPSKELYDEISRLAKVLNPEGTYAGQLLESRKLVDFNEDNLSNFLISKEAVLSKPLTDTQVKEETAKFVELKKAKEALAELEAKDKESFDKLVAEIGINKAKAARNKASKKSHEEYVKERKSTVDAAREALKKIRQDSSLKSTIPALAELKAIVPHVKELMRSFINEGVDKLDVLVKNIHAEIKDVIDITEAQLTEIIGGLHDEKQETRNDKAATLRQLKKEAKEKSRTDDQAELDSLNNRIKKLEEDIRTKKYAEEPKAKPVIKLSRETIKAKDKVIELEDKIRNERAKEEYAKRNIWLKRWDKMMQVLGVRRIVQTALDLSIPFRQGATLLSPRKIGIWAKSFSGMLKSVFNQKKYDRLMYDIRHSEDYHDMTKDGIVFNELNAVDPTQRNEDFQKSFVYKIPIIREPLLASNRAADAFLNIARYEQYMKFQKTLERQGITRQSDPKAYQFAANWAMNMTGRGKMIDALENPLARTILGNTFFGARLMASRFNLLNPVTYFDPRVPKEIRYEAMKDMAAFTSTMMGTALALAAAGGKVSLNPWDSDFLQIRFGDKVYDISGGLANYVRTFLRFVSAGYTRATGTKAEGKQAVEKAAKSALNFWRNKLSPNTSYGVDAFFGKANGKDFDALEAFKIYPMYADDAIKAAKEDGAVSLLTVLLPNILGIGYGNYGSKGTTDKDIDTLLDRNMNTDELDLSKVKNYNKGGAELTKEEKKQYIKQRNAEIEKGIQRLFNKGALIIEGNDIKLKPYKELTQEQVVAETTAIKANATRKVKKALFGEKEEDPDEQALEKELRLQKKEMFPDEFDENE